MASLGRMVARKAIVVAKRSRITNADAEEE